MTTDSQANIKQGTGYAWVILAVLFIGLLAAFGMRASFGAYISSWEEDFSISRGVVTSITMMGFIVFAASQLLAGKLNDRLGKNIVPATGLFLMVACLLLTSQATQVWQLFVFYGVGFFVGFAGCCNVVAAAIIANWFVVKRGLALGLLMAGMAVGQLIMVPTNLFVIERIGWRNTMALLSLIIIAVVGPLFIFCLRSKPSEKAMRPYGYAESGAVALSDVGAAKGSNANLPIIGIFKQKAFLLLAIPYFFCGFTDVGMIQTHLIPMVSSKAMPVTSSALAFMLIAVSNIAGTIITGHLSDIVSRTRQLAIIYAIRAVTFVWLITIQNQTFLLIFAVIYGAMEMASIAPTNSLSMQLFDRYSIGVVIALITISHELGGAVGSWIPGLLFDITGSYSMVLTIAVCALFAAAVIVLKIPEPDEKNTIIS